MKIRSQFLIVLLMVLALPVFAQKEQDPDTLVWNGKRYLLVVERNVPSITEVFFQRVGKPLPFSNWSSNNHRGHVSTYEVLNNRIYLSRIEAFRLKTRRGNLWTESGIDTVVTPDYFGISSLDSAAGAFGSSVCADWFSGVVQMMFIPENKKDTKSKEANSKRFLRIVDGAIVEDLLFSSDVLSAMAKNAEAEKVKPYKTLLSRYQKYCDFYRRCAYDREEVVFEGHKGLIEHNYNDMTLVMRRFGNNPLLWCGNWENGNWGNGSRENGDRENGNRESGSRGSSNRENGSLGNGTWESVSRDGGDTCVGAPFGEWLISGDSLFLTGVSVHIGDGQYSYSLCPQAISTVVSYYGIGDDSGDGTEIVAGTSAGDGNGLGAGSGAISIRDDGSCFASWINGDVAVHYGVWETDDFGVKRYKVSKTQKLRLANGVVVSSVFSPTSFDEDEKVLKNAGYELCDESNVWSVDDKQLAAAVGEYKKPKESPSFEGGKQSLRGWFLNHPLTNERAKDRLFRVRIGFIVNCKGEASGWRLISKPSGELFEFANMVLDIVKTLPQNWSPAKDKRGNAVDCWQILEFTVSNGVLTNASYK